MKNTQKINKQVNGKVKISKPIILDAKWTNYSQQFLGQKFVIPYQSGTIRCASETMPSIFNHYTYICQDLTQMIKKPQFKLYRQFVIKLEKYKTSFKYLLWRKKKIIEPVNLSNLI